MAKPVLILVHGAYHSTQHFEPLQKNLESHEYRCVPISLPSTQSPDLPPATLADDTAAVRNAVITELDQGNNVVVVAHSYGGCPTNNALKDLDSTSRTAAGASTSVLAIAFLCAMPQPSGVVLANMMDPKHGIHERRNDEHFCWVKKIRDPLSISTTTCPRQRQSNGAIFSGQCRGMRSKARLRTQLTWTYRRAI